MHDMDWLRERYKDEPFFDQEQVDWGGALGVGIGYKYERDFQAWATQFNEVSIHHALEVRSLEEELLLLPGLQISPERREDLGLVSEPLLNIYQLPPQTGHGQGRGPGQGEH
jgi:hypothetical protein